MTGKERLLTRQQIESIIFRRFPNGELWRAVQVRRSLLEALGQNPPVLGEGERVELQIAETPSDLTFYLFITDGNGLRRPVPAESLPQELSARSSSTPDEPNTFFDHFQLQPDEAEFLKTHNIFWQHSMASRLTFLGRR